LTEKKKKKHEENSTTISGNTTTINYEHETGSVTIPGDDNGALANAHEMNLPVQTPIL
jgi:hypothetical protein